MKSVSAKLICFLVVASISLGCQKEEKRNANEGKVEISASDKMNADELVNSAEQLLGPTTLMLAFKLSKMAVEKDPSNVKAQFYFKFLKRFEVFRGIYSRVRGSLTPEQIQKLDESLARIPRSPIKSFLTEVGGAPVQGVQGIQTVYGEYLTAVSEFYTFLKEKEDTKFEIYLNPAIFMHEISSELNRNCMIVENTDQVVRVECDTAEVALKKVNIADMIALRQVTAGEMLYGIFLNSYSLKGLEELNLQNRSLRDSVELITNKSGFGLLNSHSLLPKLTLLGSDFGAAVTWALQYKSSVCPTSTSTAQKRPGYLFRDGLCIENESETTNALQVLSNALKGTIALNIEKPNFRNINVNLFAWSRNPIQDLRTIQPTEYTADGQKVLSFKDNTLGGIFVDNNAHLILRDSQ